MKNKKTISSEKKNKWKRRIIYGLGATAGLGAVGGVAIAKNKGKIESYFKNRKKRKNSQRIQKRLESMYQPRNNKNMTSKDFIDYLSNIKTSTSTIKMAHKIQVAKDKGIISEDLAKKLINKRRQKSYKKIAQRRFGKRSTKEKY